MKKAILASFSLFLIFCSASSFADVSQENQNEILFCTKNLSGSRSGTHAEPAGELPKKQWEGMKAYATLEDRAGSLIDLRHCFVAQGAAVPIDQERIILSSFVTFGYGGIPPQYLRPGMRTGVVYNEEFNAGDVIACVPILSGTDKVVDEAYARITSHMRHASKMKDYDKFSHNCCTVAYNAALYVKANLSAVDPSSFNLRGVGVLWTPEDLPNSLFQKSSHVVALPFNFSAAVAANIEDYLSETAKSTLSADTTQFSPSNPNLDDKEEEKRDL